MTKLKTKDADIRVALHAKRLARLKENPNTLVIDELGLAHARSRIDIAVINGCIHGYEIKSEKDTLDRLGLQISIYRTTLQKLTIVAAPKHLKEIKRRVPKWCGLISADMGSRGSIGFDVERNAVMNPDVEPFMLAHLLWRDEVADLLKESGYAEAQLRRPRAHLYEILCEVMSIREITASIRMAMLRRPKWRDLPAHR